jgi:hypothetical protein
MNRNDRNKTNAVFTTTILILTMFSLIANTPKANAEYGYDYNQRHTSNLYSTNWLVSPEETQCVNDAFEEIYYRFAEQREWIYYAGNWLAGDYIYGQVKVWGATTNTTVVNQIDDANDYHWLSYVLYVGHSAWTNQTTYLRYVFYGFTSNTTTYDPLVYANPTFDDVIYGHTEGREHFVFLWSCYIAGEVGNNTPTEHGMAYCWTHQMNLNPDGYASPDNSGYCFIGFENASPWLYASLGTYGSYPGTSGDENTYQDWLENFYYFALWPEYP